MKLDNKIIIVTGGSGLIGKEIITSIKKYGGTAINADVNVESNLELGIIYCDISDENSIQNVVNIVLNKWNEKRLMLLLKYFGPERLASHIIEQKDINLLKSFNKHKAHIHKQLKQLKQLKQIN